MSRVELEHTSRGAPAIVYTVEDLTSRFELFLELS
jgi:hypothetical protein